MLDILAGNRKLNLDIREELKILTIHVEELATYQLGMEKGIAKGAHDRNVATAKSPLEEGMPTARIAAITGLSAAEVDALAQERPLRKG